MYGREYEGKTYTLEASGGLINSSLVMQDRETNSYWAIMKDEVISGKLRGTKMVELPFGKKMTWKEWVERHPETLALSVDGSEDDSFGYGSYFSSPRGFRNSQAKDSRLKTKEPIFAFHFQGEKYAVPHKTIKNGRTFKIGDKSIFLYRPAMAEIFLSTVAYLTTESSFENQNGKWLHVESGRLFNPESGEFEPGKASAPKKMQGFDTFWYNWSLANKNTILLK